MTVCDGKGNDDRGIDQRRSGPRSDRVYFVPMASFPSPHFDLGDPCPSFDS